MKTSDFDYHLPPELIAQTPAEPRDSSRLLVLHRASGRIEHSRFDRLGEYLRAGDLLVLNDSRVIPARLHARQRDSQRRAEFLLLRKVEPCTWQAIGRPGRRLRIGERFVVEASEVGVEVVERCEDGTMVLRLSTEEGMEEWGQVPLPPYIHRPLEDRERYQTIYAREPGSAAAPTAGLHFTRELMEGLSSQGVNRVYVTLRVGLDTFRPVEAEDPRRHKVHTEYFRLDPVTAAVINSTRREGGRIVAVGTTSVRTLEQAALWSEGRGDGELAPTSGWADLLILPGHRFRLVDAMITNFHLPRSTTLMLATAFAGKEPLMAAYQAAIEERYRFYSFGDGMVIL
ncbi:MAG: tRNA preQ1(34) S-adenosylmethionine ribosyltransferase-isomerase QueA [Dehalococcoidia bacterium]